MAIDWKLQAAKWRRAFWAAIDDADGAKEILAAKKARRKAKTKNPNCSREIGRKFTLQKYSF